MPLLDLPVELLHDIFTLACTDGGPTGCALSLVSRPVHALARAARFHSVVLVPATPFRVNRLRAQLARDCAADAYVPRLRHLCMSVVEGSGRFWPADADTEPSAAATAVEPNRDGRKSRPAHKEDKDNLKDCARAGTAFRDARTYTQSVSALLQLAAPDLETLTFVHCHGWVDVASMYGVECARFPALRELSLVGSYPFVEVPRTRGDYSARARPDDARDAEQEEDGDGVEEQGTAMPRLERLHLAFPWAHIAGMELLPWLARAPRLSHLRSRTCTASRTGFARSWCVRSTFSLPRDVARAHYRPHRSPNLVPPVDLRRRTRRLAAARVPEAGQRAAAAARRAPGAQRPLPARDPAAPARHAGAGRALRRRRAPGRARPPDTRLWDANWEEVARREWLDRLDGGPGAGEAQARAYMG
ncbi:uncharacterized protein BXZ73DRAFT_75376 [Epithele typhae]|uniref:uncharacterized protein n=1 Tax=Epithele typhae TaxID=378194 RepID=UPI0020072D8A|nr:uncharacterized protein BXZ73DRAFT_75376 [Epithele typhae]KAH9940837.1 hypothetical protein BXZ73DRAFT_75376 [Epithele typhae]